ncbi:ABC transporter substrate-binding protein [Tsukamurella soli]|uniref:ABC transporter substrate-binding protein n=1 Tax=Tsukamurella soli TaxID=644556 RepID=A0ABP8JGC2_9ACTN
MTSSAAGIQRSRTVVAAVLAVLLVLTGCSTQPLQVAGPSSSAAAPSIAPTLRTATVAADPVPVSPAPVPSLPVTVHSADGRDVTVRDASRIVALDRYGTYGTTVFALGLGSHLVGRDIATDFPAASHIPDLTPDGSTANAEAIIALRPTVVLTDTTMPAASTLVTQLTAAGIPVVLGNPTRSVDSTDDTLRAVAKALGVPAAGDELVRRTDDQIAQARAMVPASITSGAHRRPRIAFLYARGTGLLILGGRGSGADALISLIGGVDAGTAAGLTDPFTSLTSEGLIKAAPDALLMMTGGLTSVGGVAGLLTVPGVAQTPAGRSRTVIDMADGQLLSFGPRTGEVAIALARALYAR